MMSQPNSVTMSKSVLTGMNRMLRARRRQFGW
jgi:hypothetical protein